ncbi:hypothetical protein L9F63_009617, partial [Diploptera punctata]
ISRVFLFDLNCKSVLRYYFWGLVFNTGGNNTFQSYRMYTQSFTTPETFTQWKSCFSGPNSQLLVKVVGVIHGCYYILAMIEEAAGTRMYECKKQQSSGRLSRKRDAKLKELIQISPKLQKLQEERSQYLEYQKIQRELEYLTRFYVAWQYHSAEAVRGKTRERLEAAHTQIQNIKQEVKDGENELKELDKQAEHLKEIKNSEGGTKTRRIGDSTERKKGRREAKFIAAQKANRDNIVSEEKKLKQLERSLKEDESSLAAKEGELKKVEGLFTKLKDTDKSDAEALAAAQKKFQAVSAGLVIDDDGSDKTLQDQLM